MWGHHLHRSNFDRGFFRHLWRSCDGRFFDCDAGFVVEKFAFGQNCSRGFLQANVFGWGGILAGSRVEELAFRQHRSRGFRRAAHIFRNFRHGGRWWWCFFCGFGRGKRWRRRFCVLHLVAAVDEFFGAGPQKRRRRWWGRRALCHVITRVIAFFDEFFGFHTEFGAGFLGLWRRGGWRV